MIFNLREGQAKQVIHHPFFTISLLESEEKSHKEKAKNFQIIFFSKGKGRCNINGREYDWEPGSLFLMAPGTTISIEQGTEPPKGYRVEFSESFFCRTAEETELLYSLLFESQEQIIQFGSKRELDRLLKVSLDYMDKVYRDKTSVKIKNLLIQNMLSIILLFMYKNAGTLKADSMGYAHGSDAGGRLVVSFMKLLDESFKENHNAAFYARKLNVSLIKLNTVVHSRTGKEVKVIIREKIIAEAIHLLNSTDMSIKEIAYELGFSEPTNFNKFFQKYMLISPRGFRMAAAAPKASL